MSLYDILDVDPAAILHEVRDAFRRKARETHPDRGGDPDQFVEVTRAWMVLRDPGKRARYDATGEVDDQPDNRDSAIHGMMTQAFDAAMQEAQGQFERIDIIVLTKRQLTSKVAELNQQIAELEMAVKRIGQAVKRLIHKGKRSNFLGSMLEQRIAETKRQIANATEQEAMLVEAVERIDDYGWTVDVPINQPMYTPNPFIQSTGTASGFR